MIPISQGCFQLLQFGGKNTTRMLSCLKASKCLGALSISKRTRRPVRLLTSGTKTSLNHF